MKGVYGKALFINLDNKSFHQKEIPENVYRYYLGGKGLGLYLLYKYNRPGVDPYSPENHLILSLGPAVNTKVWGSSRYGMLTRSPQTGILVHAYSGGRVAEQIGAAGYDAIVVKGIADTATVLEIDDTEVKFHDARGLKSKNTYDTQDEIQNLVGDKAGVIVIGPAGENRVVFAVVENNYWRSIGRGGIGAVMGAKNIKGMAFHGNAEKEIAEPAVLDELWSQLRSESKDHPVMNMFRNNGTPAMVDVINKLGALPTRYWSKGTMEGADNINAASLHSRCKVQPRACSKCPMACGRLTTVQEGRHKGLQIEGPEYETIYALGSLCEIDSIEEIIYLNDLCDNLGMDTISAGNLAAFTIEASRRGKIGEKYDYGDVDGVAGLLKDMAFNRGLGAVLSKGIRYAAKQWNMEDAAVHVKGMEPSAYDPRVLKGMGLAFATSDRGACHLRSTVFKAEIAGLIPPDQIEGKAAYAIDFEDRLTLQDALIVCRFYRDIYVWDGLGKIIHGATGMKLNQEGMKAVAANIRDASQRFNRREGMTRKDDSLPPRLFKETLENGQSIKLEEMEAMLRDYYQLRGWDAEGVPPEAPEI